MSTSSATIWIIAYDIRCKKRLARVYRYLSKTAMPIQYSIFLFEGTELKLQAILRAVADRIDESVDDVRSYHIPESAKVWAFGKQFDFGEGVVATDCLPSWAKKGHAPTKGMSDIEQ
jgi:CRISPR-associated protein Cas2